MLKKQGQKLSLSQVLSFYRKYVNVMVIFNVKKFSSLSCHHLYEAFI